MRNTVLVSLFLFLAAPSWGTTIYNTGVNDSGVSLPSGAIDPHYTLVSSPDGFGPAAFVVIDGEFPFVPFFPGNPVWLPNSSISKWIGPVADGRTMIGGPPGEYIFETTFDLSANEVGTAELLGRLASDNSSEIFLNGVDTGMGASGGAACCFDHYTGFQISSGFVQGVNRLDFAVTNTDCGPKCLNPAGLRVEINLTAVPEATTFVYCLTCLLLGFKLFRRYSSNCRSQTD